jgi:hypothetical protein
MIERLAGELGREPAPRAGSGIAACQANESERGSQDSNLESPVLETGALASWATAPEGLIVSAWRPKRASRG